MINTLLLTLAIEFIGPCDVKPLLMSSVRPSETSNVGSVTIDILEKFEIPFQGTSAGLNSAFGTPIGMDALEVISDQEMRSYGWCYSVDGNSPEVMPDQFKVNASMKKITWFYAFARYSKGEWVSQCEPAFKIKPEFLCR